MTTLLDLYEYAENQGIDVDWVPLEQATSLSIPLPDGSYAIAVNPWKLDTLEQETVCLAHELGHCKTGSFTTGTLLWISGKSMRTGQTNGRSGSWCRKTLWIKPWPTDIQISRLWRSISV